MCRGGFINKEGKELKYAGTKVFKNVKGKRFIAGDVSKDDGTGGETIYGPYLDDLKLKDRTHEPPFQLGIAAPSKKDRNKNTSMFYMNYDTHRSLDFWNIIIGEFYDS